MKSFISLTSKAKVATTHFFSQQSHNIASLKDSSINFFSEGVFYFPDLIMSLPFEQHTNPPAYSIYNYFFDHKISEWHRNLSPLTLITEKLPPTAKPCFAPKATCKDLPQAFQDLIPKINFYVDAIFKTFNSELAQRNYDQGIPSQENVSEMDHGKQAGKIAILFKRPWDEVLALQFHDLSRATHEDQSYSHVHHHQETSAILKPLSLSFDYSFYHAYAKYLLNKFCPNYQKLLSPVSAHSLQIQAQSFTAQIEKLKTLSQDELKKTLYQLMFFRLIDDMSKVPQKEIQKVLDRENRDQEYLSEEVLRKVLHAQIVNSVKVYLQKNKQEAVSEFEKDLDNACVLLTRVSNEYIPQPRNSL